MEFYASCPEGFESALADELKRLGLSHVRRLKGRATFEGELEEGYRACLWSRLASRVFVVLGRFEAQDADELYDSVYDIAWENIIRPGATIAITARGVTEQLRNTRFSALRAKDALCDRLAETTGRRADVDAADPDVHLLLSLRQRRASISLDLSGDPLFKRLPPAATRAGEGAHVLRPDYAALVLAQVGWTALCERELTADDYENEALPTLIDASCAGGGLLLEAVNILTDRAPGAARERWGFEGWAGHDAAACEALLDDADRRAEAGEKNGLTLLACDTRRGAESACRQTLRAAGISREVSFVGVSEAADAVRTAKGGRLVTCDLSWLDDDSLAVEASVLSEASAVAGLSVAALAKSDSLDAALRAEPAARVDVYVGREDGELAFYEATDELAAPAEVTLAGNVRVPVLVPASDQFARRLAKVAKLRAKWARREDVSCYRVYDADLPDYSVAIELYQGLEGRGRWLQISEYAAPKDIDRQLARRRLMDVLAIAPRVLDVDPRCVNLRVRTRARGGSQYAGHGSAPTTPERHEDAYARLRGQRADLRNRHKPSLTDLPEGAHLVDEGGLTFEVNFSTRLDCGIFLDHRETRSRIREMMKQTLGSKRFLNLFAYTGTATCYAADGGAKHTTTVDLSRPSLDWARRNMARNGFRGPEHEFVQADVLSYINEQRHSPNRWDLVFCDVPTFSNSQRMRKSSFDVQRDHVELIIGVSRLLTRNGSAIFSCNLRGFKPDVEALKKAGVVLEDITEETIPEDFQRNKKIHHCYIVKRG